MSIQLIKEKLPEYANDIKLNLSSVLKDQSGLTKVQIAGIALASAYSTANKELIDVLLKEFQQELTEKEINAAKGAASIMAMNNIYYRFVHLVNDSEYQTMPAKLRMNIIAKSGIEKTDFELYALAVSAINGCGLCIDSHVQVLQKAGVGKSAIQHSIRIAAVINSAASVLQIEG